MDVQASSGLGSSLSNAISTSQPSDLALYYLCAIGTFYLIATTYKIYQRSTQIQEEHSFSILNFLKEKAETYIDVALRASAIATAAFLSIWVLLRLFFWVYRCPLPGTFPLDEVEYTRLAWVACLR